MVLTVHDCSQPVQPDEHDPRGAGILASQPRRVYQTAQGLADQQSPLARTWQASRRTPPRIRRAYSFLGTDKSLLGWARAALFVRTVTLKREREVDGLIGRMTCRCILLIALQSSLLGALVCSP